MDLDTEPGIELGAERHDWASPSYVAAWAEGDDKEDMLRLPWRLCAELVRDDGHDVRRVVDLGSGPGGFLETFLTAFPEASGVWVDGSEPMRDVARERLAPLDDRVAFVLADASRPEPAILADADVVVTSRMIHHFAPQHIRGLYAAIHAGLRPGGWFCNLDHFGAPDDFELRYRRVRPAVTGRARRTHPQHDHEAPFCTIEEHVAWLHETGFPTADHPWRTLHTALVVARRD